MPVCRRAEAGNYLYLAPLGDAIDWRDSDRNLRHLILKLNGSAASTTCGFLHRRQSTMYITTRTYNPCCPRTVQVDLLQSLNSTRTALISFISSKLHQESIRSFLTGNNYKWKNLSYHSNNVKTISIEPPSCSQIAYAFSPLEGHWYNVFRSPTQL